MNDSELEQLKQNSQRFARLLEIQRRLSSERDLETLVPVVMVETTRYMNADRSSLFLFDWKTMELSAKFAEGVDENSIRIPLKMGIMGCAILNRRTYNVSNAYEHPYFNPAVDQVHSFRTESILALPILDSEGRPLGGIQFLNKSNGRFLDADEALAEAARASLREGIVALSSRRAIEVVDELHQKIKCDRITIFRLNASDGRLSSVFAEGVDDREISLGMNLGIAGLVAVTGEEAVVNDVQGDPRFSKSFDEATGYTTRNMICLPIMNKTDEVLGVVQVINKLDGVFGAGDIELLRSLVAVISVSIENAMMFQDQDRQFHSLLEVMAASIDAKDPLTAGHSHRVAHYALMIGIELGFAERDLEVLKVAALLHDYGKIGIDDCVLKKEGKLTALEYAHIQKHAHLTHSILDKIFFSRKYRSVPLVAGSHHEYLDGSGYPQGLHAKEIPFMAKILTVADVYEALTADRHYRKGMSTEQALGILREGVGKRFDENVFAALEQATARLPKAFIEPGCVFNSIE